ncbi:MAG: ferrochelatase [Pseudomonadota bacterium]
MNSDQANARQVPAPSTPNRRGILLVNLGSPASPTEADLRTYLDEFLMDPAVITLPWPLRRFIVSAFVLRTRPAESAAAYASIWRDTEPGSPLIYYSHRFAEALRARLDMPVALAMRYGKPNIAQGLRHLQKCDEVLLLTAYPHHANSTRGTTIKAAREALLEHQTLRVVEPFFTAPDYIGVLAASIRRALPDEFDHLLFSYHGLPEAHLRKEDPTGRHCLRSDDCCETNSTAHATCYRHQVYATTHAVAAELGLTADGYSVSFQSRLGRTPWLRPYTDETLRELPARGVKHLAVASPAFIADNLETLEELGMQGRDTFLEAGGEAFTLIPCLNDDEDWADVVAHWCRTDQQIEQPE